MEAKTKYDKQNTRYHQQHGEHDNIRARCEKKQEQRTTKTKIKTTTK